MLHLPAEIATEIVSAWLSCVKQKPESQASAVPGGDPWDNGCTSHAL